ncbi:hypothetical protein EDB84DRAFT_496531 [Lactarius hengduanensis]|nr:hypothetical protein EDB84DRAFT_496531 [Lactarius hengduanensis]
MSTLKDSESRSSKALSTPGTITSFHLPPPLSLDRRTDWRALPPDASPSPRSHIPSDEEIIEAIAFVWCIHWNSFSTMDAAGLRARILAKRPSWHLLEKRVANVRSRALADGRLRRPAFEVGLRMEPSMDEVRLREHAYDFDPHWRSARHAHVCKLLKSFEITSGEVVWGQLAAFVSGMKSGVRDKALASASSSSPWRFRTAARPGIWHLSPLQIARVNAAPTPFSQSQPTGFLLHHENVDPTSVLVRARCGDAGAPCVARISDGGWGAEDHGDMIRTIVDADPEEWSALWARRWQMYLDGIWPDKHHDDAERWARLDALRTQATFFVDGAHAPEVLRLIARPSVLDERTKRDESSSLCAAAAVDRRSDIGSGCRPFGCHLSLPRPEGDELARLVFSGSRSAIFPDSDELIAFWYDSRHAEYDDVDLASVPVVEHIRA